MTGFNLSDLTHHIPPPLVFTYFTFGPVRSKRREVRPSCWGYSKHHRYHYTEERSSSCSSDDLGPSWGLLQTIHFSNDSNDSSPQVMQGCSCRVLKLKTDSFVIVAYSCDHFYCSARRSRKGLVCFWIISGDHVTWLPSDFLLIFCPIWIEGKVP